MKDLFTGKTIILGVPNHFGLPERFKENLEYLGFKVYLLEFTGKFSLDFKDKLIHVSKKIFLKDKTYKAKKKADFYAKEQIDFLENLPENIDYALIIRPDLFGKKTIEKINKKVNLSVAYQWDGLDRFPLAKEYIDDFDRFFVFDVRDVENNPKCLPITNFYFDDLMDEVPITTDVFFVGTFMNERMNLLVNMTFFLKKIKLKFKIFVITDSEKKIKKYKNSELIFLNEGMGFKENLIRTKESKTIIDFQNPRHLGVSFRAFESLGFRKKLITNNLEIKKLDFYHPNNVFFVNDKNITEIGNFLSLPLHYFDETIYEKYSFSFWIKNILKQ